MNIKIQMIPLLPPIFTDVTQIEIIFFILVKTRNTLSQKSREAKKGREWETERSQRVKIR